MLAQGASDILNVVNDGGVLGLLIVIIYAGVRRYWVFGWQYRECRDEAERAREEAARWETLALRGTRLASGATSALEKERAKR